MCFLWNVDSIWLTTQWTDTERRKISEENRTNSQGLCESCNDQTGIRSVSAWGGADRLPQCYDTWCVFEIYVFRISAGAACLRKFFLLFLSMCLRNFQLQAAVSLLFHQYWTSVSDTIRWTDSEITVLLTNLYLTFLWFVWINLKR
jgi:hypothetical protein